MAVLSGDLATQRVVILSVGQRLQLDQGVDLAFKAIPTIQLGLELVHALHDTLGILGIAPQIRVGAALF